MHYARRPLIGSASGGVYRHGTRTSTKIRPDHGSALGGPDIALFCVFSRNSTDFQADYITDRPIMSVNYCLPVSVFYF